MQDLSLIWKETKHEQENTGLNRIQLVQWTAVLCLVDVALWQGLRSKSHQGQTKNVT